MFVQQIFKDNNKENIKSPHYWPFMKQKTGRFIHKTPVMRKAFAWHNVIRRRIFSWWSGIRCFDNQHAEAWTNRPSWWQHFQTVFILRRGPGSRWFLGNDRKLKTFFTTYEKHYPNFQGAVSIRKTVLPGMAIPMLKIRRPNGRLIFNMEITIRR